MNFSIGWKKYCILCFLFAVSIGAIAQENHFIYLQTENNQLFYVKLNGKVVSSSSAGYLILPALPDGPLQLTIGFPRNEFPEEKFDLQIANQNKGFLLKNMNDKGWVLFNLQSLAIIENTSINTQVAIAKTPVKDDAFSSLLANAVNDSSLFQQNNSGDNLKQQQESAPNKVIPIDTSSIDNKSQSLQGQEIVVKSAPADTLRIYDTVFVKSGDAVNKILGVNQAAGMDMIYTVKKPSGEDTVRIFIPETQVSKPSQPEVVSANTINKAIDSSLTITPTIVPLDYKPAEELVKKDSVFNNNPDSTFAKAVIVPEKKEVIIPLDEKKVEKPIEIEDVKARPETEIIVLPQVVTSSEVNSDCVSFATDQDFLKVRRKMASATNMESMIEAAKKFFKLKCYSTEQIKNLSYLFLSEEGKYLFFDMAYAFASDSNLYQTLESQFTEPYYLNRFKAMIRK